MKNQEDLNNQNNMEKEAILSFMQVLTPIVAILILSFAFIMFSSFI